jgi:protein-S-isoprenylcysteine O-methyltransferase Ste14
MRVRNPHFPRFTHQRLLAVIAVMIYYVPGVVWTVNYMLLEFRRSSGGGGLTGLAALIVGVAFLLLFLLFCFLPPAALLIWGPIETKVFLIAYFVLSYGLLFLWATGRFGHAKKHDLAPKPAS